MAIFAIFCTCVEGNGNSSILAWRIPVTEEPGGLLSMYGVGQGQTRLKQLSSSSSSSSSNMHMCFIMKCTIFIVRKNKDPSIWKVKMQKILKLIWRHKRP